jgi:hypothetical protein
MKTQRPTQGVTFGCGDDDTWTDDEYQLSVIAYVFQVIFGEITVAGFHGFAARASDYRHSGSI